MKKIALVAASAGLCVLPACTTANPARRTMTNWNLGMLRERPDPCGTMPASKPMKDDCGGDAQRASGQFIDSVFVKPIAFVMLPISWATDTLILNPIDGYKKAELQNHERRYCIADAEDNNWSDAHAAHHAGGVIPVATPWVVSDALYLPEFAARWVWNSVSPTDPVDQERYNEYWDEHNENQPD